MSHGALDLRDHDHVELVADLGDERASGRRAPTGDSSALTRVQSCVSPRSISLPTLIRPARAASLRSTGTASSRLPSRMSAFGAMSRQLGDHLLVGGVEEVDHPRRQERDLPDRLGRADGEGLEEVSGVSHEGLDAIGRAAVEVAPRIGASKCHPDVRETAERCVFDVVPGEAQRKPAGQHRQAIAAAVPAIGGPGAVGVEPVELDEDPLVRPHEVGLEDLAEVELAVDDGLRQAGTAQAGKEPSLEQAPRRTTPRAMRGEQVAEGGRAGRAPLEHLLDDLRPNGSATLRAFEAGLEERGAREVDEGLRHRRARDAADVGAAGRWTYGGRPRPAAVAAAGTVM